MSDDQEAEGFAEDVGRLAQRVATDELLWFTRSLREANVITEEQQATLDAALMERGKAAGMSFEDEPTAP